ncbi:MAG TPA: hypothetical protein HPP65_03460 [Gammaproteobacteria bacterium]|jgi:hypothetical protein|nr:hypothetical protein [Candidatus Neomarinimicrobiota bacterium]HIJ31641.1 hypothetical protein [Gammaproteobacteria bacterium]HIJ33446.1 hypothetical protein [Gammaproteobacteria bacterium]HIJ47919.1 hypothetical protein [Gammaproteobacteria bacterium]
MQVEAIYDHGKIEFIKPLKFKHEKIKVTLDIPDNEIEQLQLFEPKTELGLKLQQIKEQGQSQKEKKLNIDEINAEVHRRRGGIDR